MFRPLKSYNKPFYTNVKNQMQLKEKVQQT